MFQILARAYFGCLLGLTWHAWLDVHDLNTTMHTESQPRPRLFSAFKKSSQPRSQALLCVQYDQYGRLKKALTNRTSRDHKLANHKPAAILKTIQIFNIFGDTWPAACQGLLRAAILNAEKTLGTRLKRLQNPANTVLQNLHQQRSMHHLQVLLKFFPPTCDSWHVEIFARIIRNGRLCLISCKWV